MSCFQRLDSEGEATYNRRLYPGAIAQLGERLHGMQEVGGSIPPSSTKALVLGIEKYEYPSNLGLNAASSAREIGVYF